MSNPLACDQNVLIIGASHAGISLAEQLRKNGFEGGITLIDREASMPMERPPLSKAWLLEGGKSDSGRFLMRQAEWFKENRVEFRPNCEAVKADASRRVVVLASGEEIAWDRLVLATGAIPRALPIPGGDDDRVHVLRVPEDAEKLSAALDTAGSLAVIGGGYIGLEVAATARKRGLEVSVIEMAPRLLARVASAEASAFFETLHRENGVEIITGANVAGLSRDGDHCVLDIGEGRVVNADIVVAGIGVIPDMALAESLGLETGNGLLVSQHYQTEVEDVFAIGDVALPAGGYTNGAIRIESVHHAQMSAEIVAAVMMGNPPKDHEVPWFWSDQYDRKLQSAGMVAADVETISRAGRRDGAISFWSFVGGQLQAVEAINDPQAFMIAKTVMGDGTPVHPDQIADPALDLKSFIRR